MLRKLSRAGVVITQRVSRYALGASCSAVLLDVANTVGHWDDAEGVPDLVTLVAG